MQIKGIITIFLLLFLVFFLGCTDTVDVNVIDSNAITTTDTNNSTDTNKPFDLNQPVIDTNKPVMSDINSIKREVSDCIFKCADTKEKAVPCSTNCFNQITQNMMQSQKVQLLSSCIAPCRAKGGEQFACLEACRGKELTPIEKCLQTCTISGKEYPSCLEECKVPGAVTSDKNSPADTNNP